MKTALLYLSFLVPYFTLLAQDGAIDPSFNPGTAFYNGNITQIVTTTTIQPDGKIIVGGNFNYYNGIYLNPGLTLNLIRLQEDGTIDPAFNYGTGGYSGGSGTYNNLCSAIQNDGKIIVAGDFTSYNGNTKNRIVRLNADGTIDGSFIIGTGFNNVVKSMMIQTDGKIIVGGRFTSFNGTSINRICRLNVNGTLDFSFNPGNGFNDDVNSIAIQSDGKLLIGGQFSTFNGQVSKHLTRLNSNGSIDLTFDIGSGFTYNGSDGVTIYAIELQSDGEILVGGTYTKYQGINTKGLIKLIPDGTIDSSFHLDNNISLGILCIKTQSDGRILIGGSMNYNNGNTFIHGLTRLLPNGNFDETFNPSEPSFSGGFYMPANSAFPGFVSTINLMENNKILVGGLFAYYNYQNTLSTVNSIIQLNSCSSFSLETIAVCEPYLWEGQTYSSSGSYFTNFTGSNGCDSTKFLSLTIGFINNLFTSVSGATITASNTNATYQWLDCNNNYAVIPGAINQSFTPSSNGSYAVQLTENGCSDTTLCVQISNLGLNVNYSTLFTIHPNPATNQVIISSQFFTENEAVQIFNTAGQLVLEYPNLSPQDQTYTINVEQLNSGIYFIKIGESTQKLIIQ